MIHNIWSSHYSCYVLLLYIIIINNTNRTPKGFLARDANEVERAAWRAEVEHKGFLYYFSPTKDSLLFLSQRTSLLFQCEPAAAAHKFWGVLRWRLKRHAEYMGAAELRGRWSEIVSHEQEQAERIKESSFCIAAAFLSHTVANRRVHQNENCTLVYGYKHVTKIKDSEWGRSMSGSRNPGSLRTRRSCDWSC